MATRAGERAVERTPEQLDVLAEAGVVDAGAHGLVVIMAGIVAGLRDDSSAAGDPAPRARADHAAAPRRQPVPVLHQLHRHRQRARRPVVRLPARGDRRLRARGRRRGDAEGPRPHRRAGGGGRRLRGGRTRAAARRGRHARADRSAGARAWHPSKSGALVVAAGDGMRSLFEGLGAHVVDGGPTLNPSTVRAPRRDPRGDLPRRSSCCPTRRT